MNIEHSYIKFTSLEDSGDERGSIFRLPRYLEYILNGIADIPIVTIRPGRVRGNHYHAVYRETVIVLYEDNWSFYWQTGLEIERQSKNFEGRGAILVEIEPRVSHALKNDGNSNVYLFEIAYKKHDPASPDIFRSVITD